MAYKFKCGKCGRDLMVKWLKAGETAKCHKCGADVKVPVNALEIDNDLVPLPEPVTKVEVPPLSRENCPTCRYLERIDEAEFEGSLPLGTFGACHRYPPAVEGRYPFVTPADWCGEYERND